MTVDLADLGVESDAKLKADLEKILKELEDMGIKKHGRIKWLAERMDYSKTLIGDVIRGKRSITPRFITLANSAIEEHHKVKHILVNEFKTIHQLIGEDDSKMNRNKGEAEKYELWQSVRDSSICIEAIKEIKKMPEPKRYRAVAMLKEMNAEGE